MEYRTIMCALLDFMHLHRQRVQAYVDEVKLYHGQLPILEAIKDHDGCTQNKLTEVLHISAPSITNSIRRLENKGLVVKSVDESDNRRSILRITKEGKEVAEQCRRRFDEIDVVCFKGISEEEKELLYSIMKRMSENLREEDRHD